MRRVALGLEVLLSERISLIKGERVGLVCNPSSVDHGLNHAADLLGSHVNVTLKALFGPQHGIRGETQDNMIEWEDFRDPLTGITAYSLYGKVRKPTPEMLEPLDVLIFDIQDVGTRVYTFIYTMALAMQAAGETGKRVIVLDRPNPISCNRLEGSLLLAGNESFVGMFPIPMRHGMTVGELAGMFSGEFNVDCELEVVPMRGYHRNLWFDETDAPWVIPSPNMPRLSTATVYPGSVLLEGTKLSEGRGTTIPFELTGAPYAEAHRVADYLNRQEIKGVHFRPHSFIPTFQKYSGELCHGIQIHVLDREDFRPVITGVAVIKAFHDLYQGNFAWQEPPYEYVYDRLPFDVISGGSVLREQIEKGVGIDEIADSWRADELDFAQRRGPYQLY